MAKHLSSSLSDYIANPFFSAKQPSSVIDIPQPLDGSVANAVRPEGNSPARPFVCLTEVKAAVAATQHDDAGLIVTLENYAVVLRELRRHREAEQVEARADSLRAKL